MKVGEFCNREVVIVKGDESLKVVAELMRTHHVGDVVLIKEEHQKRIPMGIITDRDLVLEILVPGLELEKVAAKDIMTEPLCLIHENNSLFDALELMKERGIRRLPVVDDANALVGILTIDDLIEILTEMIGCISDVIKVQPKQEKRRLP